VEGGEQHKKEKGGCGHSSAPTRFGVNQKGGKETGGPPSAQKKKNQKEERSKKIA